MKKTGPVTRSRLGHFFGAVLIIAIATGVSPSHSEEQPLARGESEARARFGWERWNGMFWARSRASSGSIQDFGGWGPAGSLRYRLGLGETEFFKEFSGSVGVFSTDGRETLDSRVKVRAAEFPAGTRVDHNLDILDVALDTFHIHYRRQEFSLDDGTKRKGLNDDLFMLTLAGDGRARLPLTDLDLGLSASGRLSVGDLSFRRFDLLAATDLGVDWNLKGGWKFFAGADYDLFFLSERLGFQNRVGPVVHLSRRW